MHGRVLEKFDGYLPEFQGKSSSSAALGPPTPFPQPTVASRRVPDALRERIRDLVDVGEEVVRVDHLRARGVVQRGDVVEVVREVLHLLELDVLVDAVGAHLRRRRPRRRALDHLRLGVREFLKRLV